MTYIWIGLACWMALSLVVAAFYCTLAYLQNRNFHRRYPNRR